MATNYPGALDTLANPAAGNATNSPSHASQHADANDSIEAIEAKVGTGASTPANNTFLIGTGAGTSSWSAITSAQLAARISDETGTGSAVFATTPTLVTPKVDTINESTPANGVTIDSLNIKDGALNTSNSVVTSNITAGAVTGSKLTLSYGFSAYSTAAQNSGNGAFAQTLFATEEYDIGSNFASSTFTVPVTGYYHIDASVGSAASASTWISSLFKNGTEFKRGGDFRTAINPNTSALSVTVKLTAADTLDIRTFGNGAIAINVTQATCYFMGYFIGN